MIVTIKNIICADLKRWISTSSQTFLRLDQLIKYQRYERISQKIRRQDSDIFEYGSDPVKFKLHLYGFFKYSYWETSSFAEQKLLNFISKMNQDTGKMVTAYREIISTVILPLKIGTSSFTVLTRSKFLNINQINQISQNITKIFLEQKSDFIFASNFESYWLFIDTIGLFLTRCLANMHLIIPNQKSNIIRMAKVMKIKNYEFLDYLKKDIQKQYKDIGLSGFLSALCYLSENQTFPYEFFYRKKRYLLDCISYQEDLGERKIVHAINMMEIFTKVRLFHCEQILQKLFVIIQKNLPSADANKLIQIFFLASKVKGGVDPHFIDAIVARIEQFLETLNQKQYTLLVKSLINLNYSQKPFLQKVKSYNYEIFLTELTFSSSTLSKYYQNLIDQLQQRAEESELRKISYDDSPFKPVEVDNISQLVST